MSGRVIVAAFLALTAGPGRGDSPTTQPADRGPALGRIEGRISPAPAVKSVRCIDRGFNLVYPVEWTAPPVPADPSGGDAPAAGRFVAADLAPGRAYDLEVTAADGRTFIGVDLGGDRIAWTAGHDEAWPSSAERQAGAGAGADDEPPGPLTDDDRGEINRIVTEVEGFENERRIVHLRGDHSWAAALVELRRTTPFHRSTPGEQIRRIEIWYFQFQHGGWAKVANAEKVLSRVRGPADQIDARARREVYVPELGGIRLDAAGRADPLDVTLPGFAPPAPTTRPYEEQQPGRGGT